MREGDLTAQIIGGAIEVHRHWGPGLYEEIYERSLYHELRLRKVAFESQVKLPLLYKGERVGDDLRLDLIVEGKVVVELKAIKTLEPIHEAQLLTYMKLTGCEVGLLINFNAPRVETGNQTDGSVMCPSSSSPHKPSAQMGDWQSITPTRHKKSGDCQSPICADLSSESLCLRGESSCTAQKYRMQVRREMPETLVSAGVCHSLRSLPLETTACCSRTRCGGPV